MRGATTPVIVEVPEDRFQSTLPVRGATDEHPGEEYGYRFQSTLPVRGATPVLIT